MTHPISLQSETVKSDSEKIITAHPKKPVQAACQSVKEAVTRELDFHQVKQASGYQRVGQAVAKKLTSSLEEGKVSQAAKNKSIGEAHIQEKKAKNITYKKGNGEITLDELFMIQNGENHG